MIYSNQAGMAKADAKTAGLVGWAEQLGEARTGDSGLIPKLNWTDRFN